MARISGSYVSKQEVRYHFDGETDALVLEEWFNGSGERSRGFDLPAVVAYDLSTGSPIREEWWTGGKRNRLGGKPAVVHYDPATAVVTGMQWFSMGKKVLPAGARSQSLEP